MRLNELSSIIIEHRELSPDVIRAQRQAELKNLAEYRARRLRAYLEWSKPENIAKRQAEHEANAQSAWEAGLAMSKLAKEQLAEKKLDDELRRPVPFKLTLMSKPKTRTWWQRLLDWIFE